jgi:hypothetical protein
MADSHSVIYLTNGIRITVETDLSVLEEKIFGAHDPDAPPFISIMDTDGRDHLINLNAIVGIEGWKRP